MDVTSLLSFVLGNIGGYVTSLLSVVLGNTGVCDVTAVICAR